VCFGTGDFYFVADTIDTIKRSAPTATDCATGATTIYTPPTPLVGTVVEGGNINGTVIAPRTH
jgi:hypothetical protein